MYPFLECQHNSHHLLNMNIIVHFCRGELSGQEGNWMYLTVLLCLLVYSSHCIITCIGFDYRWQGWITVCKDRGRGKFLFEHVKAFLTSRSLRPRFIFASQGRLGYGYLCKSLNEPSVEVCKPQKLLDIFDLSWDCPIFNFVYFLFGHLYAPFRDYVTKELNFVNMKGTLL